MGVFCTCGVCVSGLSFSGLLVYMYVCMSEEMYIGTMDNVVLLVLKGGIFFLFLGVFYVYFKFLPGFLKSFSNFL